MAGLADSKIFSNASLAAGTAVLRDQHVKIENDEERKNIEAELQDCLLV